MTVLIALGVYLLGACCQTTIASSVDVIVPDNVDGLKFPDIVAESFHEDNKAVIEDSLPSTSTHDTSCRVYIAPSSIPGAGMGIFAGESFKYGDEVTTADAVVPLVDLAWNNDISSFVDTNLWGE